LNLTEAARLYRLSAAQGHADAQRNLGVMYCNGQGVAGNFVEAARLLKLAAAQGDAHAQYMAGGLYSQSMGVSRDYVEAARLYRLSAAQGEVCAREALARLASEREYVAVCCMGGALLRRGVRAAFVGRAQAALQALGGSCGRAAMMGPSFEPALRAPSRRAQRMTSRHLSQCAAPRA
jgi:TPR repeat protein